MIVSLATVFEFQAYSSDVTQAYLKLSGNLIRDVYLNLPKKMNLQPNKLIELLKPL